MIWKIGSFIDTNSCMNTKFMHLYLLNLYAVFNFYVFTIYLDINKKIDIHIMNLNNIENS